VPLLAFMLIPVWIPVIATIAGAGYDRIRPKSVTPARAAVEAAKDRSLAIRPGPTTAGPAPTTLPIVRDEIADRTIAA